MNSNNKRVVIHSLSLAIIFGVIEGLLGVKDSTPAYLEFAEALTVNLVMFYWFVHDRNARGYRKSKFFNFCIVVFGFFAVAYYLLRSRGFPSGLKILAVAIALILVSASTFSLAWILSYELFA